MIKTLNKDNFVLDFSNINFSLIIKMIEYGSMKIKPRIIFRLFSTIFCASGLLYQCFQLLSQYLSGKSVVNVEVKRELYPSLPAITLCYPEMVSMELAANYSDIYRHYYERYKDIIDMIDENRTKYEMFEENITKLYKAFVKRLQREDQPEMIKTIFNNLSLPYLYGFNENNFQNLHEESIINTWILGTPYKQGHGYNTLFKNRDKNSSYFLVGNPVETVNYNLNAKCFTFFSVIDPVWIDIRFNLDIIRMVIKNNVNWFPPHLIDKYYLTIHSPNQFPELRIGLEFDEISPNSNYYVSFAKIDVDRFYSGTESNCLDYSIKNFVNLRSDCITTCILQKAHDENIRNAQSIMKTLFRREHIDKIRVSRSHYTYSDSPERFTFITQDCHRMCKHNCKYTYFMYDINKINNTEKYTNLTDKSSYLTIQHNRLPDLFVRHVPETTFISFVGNFGGLLGMWLGINGLMIFDIVYKTMKRIIIWFGKSDDHDKIFIIQRNRFSINLRNPSFVQINNLT